MTFNIQPVLTAMQTLVQNTNQFKTVVVGEPFSPPESMTAAIFMSHLEELEATLASSIEVHEVTIRIYHLALTEPRANIEYETHAATVALLAALAGGFTISGQVRAVSFAGEMGAGKVRARWGHVDLSGTIFRCVDISVPLLVDDDLIYTP